MVYESNSWEDTFNLGKRLGQAARAGQVYCLDGDLGVGKTVFTQGFAQGLGIDVYKRQVREAARRVLNMEHFPVQLIGGIVLHQGRIAEMKTGEGKTLVSTCPAYLNALAGKGVQIVTVNDLSLIHI